MDSFTHSTTPNLHFGPGKISVLPSAAKSFGSKILLITGTRSFPSSNNGLDLLEQLNARKMHVEHFTIEKEPSPGVIDHAVKTFYAFAPDVVVAIGGGSVLDAGKGISAMLPLNEPVKPYLEGVGKKPVHPGVKIPFIAVPTTAGTGSEATKNAVLSEIGKRGYKKSLRHNNFVPDIAIVDPVLTISCPPSITAASGMDAFTQLLESYLSTKANPITDALAYEGLKRVSFSLMQAYHNGTDLEARTNMALASYISGITLANAGLGLVHGLASAIGGYFEISHGVICSSLILAANKVTIRKLRSGKTANNALTKYALVGKMFSRSEDKSDEYYADLLLSVMETWTKEMNIPPLSEGGITKKDLEKISAASDNKNNPIPLNREEMIEVLELAS
ncbi:MAG: alcohol dehydrogenase [Marivirga sp.]|nr:alcohol dehydrogenase [Marivirga sp.]